ncbi:MAG: M28 family peptidase [Bacteroidetes bacterium]|nr:M28 family peptidase [Bacteroidota bacterium]
MKLLVFISLLISQLVLPAQHPMDSDRVALYRKIIKTLCADSMQGRGVSGVGGKKTAHFIYHEFKSVKHASTGFQNFKYRVADTIPADSSQNVFCFINNHADSTVLIGAHYDHIGLGGVLSRSYMKNTVHPGADDNASGVALMIGLLSNYKTWSQKKYNYLFVSYSAHEIGLFGSRAFHEYCTKQFKPLCLVINFDMVGRLDSRQPVLNIYGIQTVSSRRNKIDSLSFPGKVYTNENDKIYETDAVSYVKSGIPALSFTTGIHTDYHKVSDTESKINYNGLLIIQKYLEELLKQTP